MDSNFEEDFILSMNGEVRGRKNLVKELAKSSLIEKVIQQNSFPNKPNYVVIQKESNDHFDKQNTHEMASIKLISNQKESEYSQRFYEWPKENAVPKINFISKNSSNVILDDPNFQKIHNSTTSIIVSKKQFNSNENLNLVDVNNLRFRSTKGNGVYFPRPNVNIQTQVEFPDRNDNDNEKYEPEQEATDFGYWDYKMQLDNKQKPYSFGVEDEQSFQLPDLYSYEYGKLKSNSKSKKEWNRSEHDEGIINNDEVEISRIINMKNSDELSFDILKNNNGFSRNSSIRSYNKMLPVGKFAKQKFHIVQDEEEMLELPNLYELNGELLHNLEFTNEFNCITESVSIDMRKFSNVEVIVNIFVNKYIKKNPLEKLWTKKFVEISRTIDIDVEASGERERIEKLIIDVQQKKDEKYSIKQSIYRLKSDKFQLSGYAAFKVFKTLMGIAESFQSTSSETGDNTKFKLTPQYLLAVLEESNSSFFPYY